MRNNPKRVIFANVINYETLRKKYNCKYST
nr:MAG TPA: hypothetical protein [Caudoviricetes sp.]